MEDPPVGYGIAALDSVAEGGGARSVEGAGSDHKSRAHEALAAASKATSGSTHDTESWRRCKRPAANTLFVKLEQDLFIQAKTILGVSQDENLEESFNCVIP